MMGATLQGAADAEFKTGVVDLAMIARKPPAGWNRLDLEAPRPFRYVRLLGPNGGYGTVAELEVWGVAGGTVLEQEVARMLDDPKARALTANFAARWMQVDRLPAARPSTEFFPEFSTDVRKALYEEATAFFDNLRAEDRNLAELLDADYTFLNEDLAKYYKIPGVEGKALRRVPLRPEYRRGGLLGMGGVLAVTSHTSRTSPTMRGKWVLEVLFGTPPPPPPANAGMLKEKDEPGKEPRSFREKMAMHASEPSCAGCHRKMDPLGFALDQFNAAGIWRDDDGGKPLDTSGELPTGETFRGVDGLKRLLLARRGEFLHNLTEQMLVYALGRELDYNDDRTVNAIAAGLEREGGRFSALVRGIVMSDAFLYRRNSEPDAPPPAE